MLTCSGYIDFLFSCNGVDKCKDETLKCAAGQSCIVQCGGESSCGGNTVIDGSSATDVNINCIGTDSCKGNTIIRCGSGDCILVCGESKSCEDSTINTAKANSFRCEGQCNGGNIPTNSPIIHSTIHSTMTLTTSSTKIPNDNTPTNLPSISPTSHNDHPSPSVIKTTLMNVVATKVTNSLIESSLIFTSTEYSETSEEQKNFTTDFNPESDDFEPTLQEEIDSDHHSLLSTPFSLTLQNVIIVGIILSALIFICICICWKCVKHKKKHDNTLSKMRSKSIDEHQYQSMKLPSDSLQHIFANICKCYLSTSIKIFFVCLPS